MEEQWNITFNVGRNFRYKGVYEMELINEYNYGDYTIRQYKNETNSFPIRVEYLGEYVGDGNNKKHLVKIAEKLKVRVGDKDTSQSLGRKVVGKLVREKKAMNNLEEDYLNFYRMLQFWIEQTDNNIENTGRRVSFKEIKEDNVKDAEDMFKNPQFKRKFLKYANFSIYISFFRNGQYKGTKVNWIMWKTSEKMPVWLNICYDCNKKTMGISLGNSSGEIDSYLEREGYSDSEKYPLIELELNKKTPNSKVKELFDYYSGLISSLKKYSEDGESSMLVEELKDKLKKSHNIILHGAPGTGKTYLAKEIAASFISIENNELENSEQFASVQFHPSYDYTDFIEGLRPSENKNGQVGFKLMNGVFKSFCEKAKTNYYVTETDDTEFTWEGFEEFMRSFEGNKTDSYLSYIKLLLGKREYRGEKVESIPVYSDLNAIMKNVDEIKEFDKKHDFHNNIATPVQYVLAYYEQKRKEENRASTKPYVFLIDEINRGEISKIFGELFFSIDPGYRGEAGAISTQYTNMHEDPNEKFYIPENVYIIGTMNDIDRSVDSFDFAMRRRFRFIEIKADERLEMLDSLGADKEEAIQRMTSLNDAIAEVDELNENYHIGASYFLKLKAMNFDQLWEDYLQPLLHDYIRGMYDEEDIMSKFASAYRYSKSQAGKSDVRNQD